MATVGLVLFALGPGVATVAADSAGNDTLDVSVNQAGNTGPVVTVTDNGTGVENASVSVETVENVSYAGTGEYTSDANGTVSLPTPGANVTVEVTATYGNATASTTAELLAGSGNDTAANFGTEMSSFVESLLSGDSKNIGQQVSEYARENNPGNAPDHAGPPEDKERGPPEHAGPGDADDNETDDRRGPPEHAGPGGADDNETDDRRGPPEDRGDDSEDVNETEDDDSEDVNETAEEEETEDDETDDEAETEEDDSGGPPEHAKGNGR